MTQAWLAQPLVQLHITCCIFSPQSSNQAMRRSSIEGDAAVEFRARPLGRGHFAPFQVQGSKSEPTRSISPETLRRSKAVKKVVVEEHIAEFKAKPLPSFIKRRASSSGIQNKDGNSTLRPDDTLRRKSANLAIKPFASPSKITKPAPFALHCDKLMSSRKQAEAERAERLQRAEEERRQKQKLLQEMKDRETEEELNKNMFKARPLPKYLSRKLPSNQSVEG